jgi:hypothetical protein
MRYLAATRIAPAPPPPASAGRSTALRKLFFSARLAALCLGHP